MAEQFNEQGGAVTMDPSPLLRWLISKVMTRLSKPARLEKKRLKLEKKRIKAGLPHVVEYFHQLDDGYSQLAAQVLKNLAARYDIQLVCHLVSASVGKNAPEPELLNKLSGYDAFQVAPAYGLEFPEHSQTPQASLLKLATSILAAQSVADFVERAADVGQALWTGDEAALQVLAERYSVASDEQVAAKIATGNARREAIKHYSGAMFYYSEEWYWGVDRLYHLEQRLAGLGVDKQVGQAMLMPRPAIEIGEIKDTGRLTLEVYPSLRSPYTAISFDRAVKLAKDTGVKLVVRPILPMVMRGVPVPRQKGMYIFGDTVREAHAAGIPFGNYYEPIGEPVRRCYSLYPWACEQGKGTELISAFLSCAFAEGVNTNTEKGLKVVVEKAGLNWQQAKPLIGQPGWESLLEENRLAMYEAGLWGVPSFRLLDSDGEQLLALWGQDRLWLFAREIQQQLSLR